MRLVLILVGLLVGVATLVLGSYLVLVAIHGRDGAVEAIFGPIERSPVDFATLELSPKPNQYLVCPEGYCAAHPNRVSERYPMTAAELGRRWNSFVSEQPQVKLLSTNEADQQSDYEARTSLVRFPDTVTVRFIDLGNNESTLAIYSRSHYGHSDLGANQKRIDAWLAALE